MNKSVMIVTNSNYEDKQVIVLGSFGALNCDAVRELLNLKRNTEDEDIITISFEEWTDEKIEEARCDD